MDKMKISYNTGPFRCENFEHMCQAFQALELTNLELHLGHMFSIPMVLNPSYVLQTVKSHNLNIILVDGGWCDLTDAGNEGIGNIKEQIKITRVLGAKAIRLFFTPTPLEYITDNELNTISDNLQHLATTYPDINLLFETHDELGTSAHLVRELLESVKHNQNIGLVFDPINFMVHKKDPIEALDQLTNYVKHVHLKGLTYDENLCAFGEGKDISDIVIALRQFTDSFGLEYEGHWCPILGLMQSKSNLIKLCKSVDEEDY